MFFSRPSLFYLGFNVTYFVSLGCCVFGLSVPLLVVDWKDPHSEPPKRVDGMLDLLHSLAHSL